MYVVCLVWTLSPFLLTLQILTHVGTTASCVERESVLMVLATDIVLLYGLSSFFSPPRDLMEKRRTSNGIPTMNFGSGSRT